VPWLSGRLKISQASLGSLKVCVSELFNNIKDHTQHEIGCIFAQHFPYLEKVEVSLSDFGVGIPYNVRKKLADLSDSEAITHAVKEGFTTKSTQRNKGVGLDYLLQTVVGNYRGQVTIYSGSSIVTFVRGEAVVSYQ
jgi:anti-sigma regulatory factor (Ser/Thr protein kinase)